VDGTTDFFLILAWVQCMTAPGPDPFFLPTLTGIPVPDDNSLFTVYLPTNTAINDLFFKSCADFGAYHFFGETLAWHIEEIPLPPFFLPVLERQSVPFAVLPADCAISGAADPMDGISVNATHEIIEATTDPIILEGWVDNSTAGFNGDILKKGESADICERGVGDVPTSPVRLENGLLVAPYWSNVENRCVPVTRTVRLDQTGLPATVAHEAQFDGSTVSLAFSTTVADATTHSFGFPTPVSDPNPLTRYVTSEPPATLSVTADVSKTATYTTQHFLTVQATPAAAAAIDQTLTPSTWEDAGTVANLATDPLITTGPGARFRFGQWTGDASGSSPSTSVLMNAPRTAVANYISQHLVTVSTHGLGTNLTHVFNGSTVIGTANDTTPLATFVDDGPLALTADAGVSGTGGVQYFFQRFTPVPPTVLTAATSTTANYETIAQLLSDALAGGGIFGPGAAGLANSFRRQFDAVQADIAENHHGEVLLELGGFIDHVQAQQGIHLTVALSRTLQLDALLVFHDQLCRAISSGQVNGATANIAYAFYSARVASLGGAVLPPC
jgi:hypothetical protein